MRCAACRQLETRGLGRARRRPAVVGVLQKQAQTTQTGTGEDQDEVPPEKSVQERKLEEGVASLGRGRGTTRRGAQQRASSGSCARARATRSKATRGRLERYLVEMGVRWMDGSRFTHHSRCWVPPSAGPPRVSTISNGWRPPGHDLFPAQCLPRPLLRSLLKRRLGFTRRCPRCSWQVAPSIGRAATFSNTRRQFALDGAPPCSAVIFCSAPISLVHRPYPRVCGAFQCLVMR